MQAEVKMRRLPLNPECSWVVLLEIMMAIAPAIPSSSPNSFIFVKRSNPTNTDNKRTMRGVVVLIIEPSMGEVCDRPNIIQSLRDMPIRSAAPKILMRSSAAILSCFSHSIGMSDHTAATTNDADTIAKGVM